MKRTSIFTVPLLVFVAVGIVSFAPLLFLLSCGLLPTWVACAMGQPKEESWCVGLMNVAGVLPYAFELFNRPFTIYTVQKMFATPYTWLTMYGVAGLGWLLYMGTPLLIRMMISGRDYYTLMIIRQKQARLKRLWGNDIAKKFD